MTNMSPRLQTRIQSKRTHPRITFAVLPYFAAIFAAMTALIFSSLLSTPVRATEWISSLKGGSGQYVLRRDGKTVPVQPLVRLHVGDTLSVKSTKGRIEVLKSDNSLHIVTHKNTPYVVPASPEAPSVWSNLLNIASKWVGSDTRDSTSVNMVTRGVGFTGSPRPIFVISAPAEENFVLAGENELDVHWSGGGARFEAMLLNEDESRVLARIKNISKSHVKFKTRALKLGIYSIKIRSKGPGRRTANQVFIRVVRAGKLPDAARKLAAAPLPSRLKKRLMVTALAQSPDWQFLAHSRARRFGYKEEAKKMAMQRYPNRR